MLSSVGKLAPRVSPAMSSNHLRLMTTASANDAVLPAVVLRCLVCLNSTLCVLVSEVSLTDVTERHKEAAILVLSKVQSLRGKRMFCAASTQSRTTGRRNSNAPPETSTIPSDEYT